MLHPQIQNFQQLTKNCLEPSIYNLKILTAFLCYAEENDLHHYPIHLKFNTGLNRLGFNYSDTQAILTKIQGLKYLKIASIFSHLAASEDLDEKEFTLGQLNHLSLILRVIHYF